jgi:hypothetical protein
MHVDLCCMSVFGGVNYSGAVFCVICRLLNVESLCVCIWSI